MATFLPEDDVRRQLVISIAQGEIGTVFAKQAEPGSIAGTSRRRHGWVNLMKYFGTAAPGLCNNDVIMYVDKSGLPSWCGVFALWAFKAAGLSVGNWVGGGGIGNVSGFWFHGGGKLKPPSRPFPGDVGVIQKPPYCTERVDHHNIIIKAVGNLVYTIDGNAYDKEGKAAGTVTLKEWAITEFDNFYSLTAAAGNVPGMEIPSPNIFIPGENPLEPYVVFPPTSPSAAPATPTATPTVMPNAGKHTVVAGDTLQKISMKYYGTVSKWNVIYNANKQVIGPDPGKIHIGQILTIP